MKQKRLKTSEGCAAHRLMTLSARLKQKRAGITFPCTCAHEIDVEVPSKSHRKRIEGGVTCGIYKISSPAGLPYIGQSKQIEHRWDDHRTNVLNPKVVYYNNLFREHVQLYGG